MILTAVECVLLRFLFALIDWWHWVLWNAVDDAIFALHWCEYKSSSLSIKFHPLFKCVTQICRAWEFEGVFAERIAAAADIRRFSHWVHDLLRLYSADIVGKRPTCPQSLPVRNSQSMHFVFTQQISSLIHATVCSWTFMVIIALAYALNLFWFGKVCPKCAILSLTIKYDDRHPCTDAAGGLWHVAWGRGITATRGGRYHSGEGSIEETEDSVMNIFALAAAFQ